eukprot:gene2448-biopygen7097
MVIASHSAFPPFRAPGRTAHAQKDPLLWKSDLSEVSLKEGVTPFTLHRWLCDTPGTCVVFAIVPTYLKDRVLQTSDISSLSRSVSRRFSRRRQAAPISRGRRGGIARIGNRRHRYPALPTTTRQAGQGEQ